METGNKAAAEKAAALAGEILGLSRSELLVALRFLDGALFRLTDIEGETETYAVDGSHLFYSVRHVLLSAREERETVVRDILHMVLHCVFSHPFAGGGVDPLLYDLAADIAVENIINELGLASLVCKRQNRQDQIIERLQKRLRLLSVQGIYRFLVDAAYSEEELLALRQDFYADNHGIWYLPIAGQGEDGRDAAAVDDALQERKRQLKTNAAAAAQWEGIGRSLRMEIDLFSKEWGSRSDSLLRTLDDLLREKYDYRDFLRRFAVSGETLHASLEEFDYIFYTYGLTLYQNMPLIEPLEYREETKIREFVIAIDTSASVSHRLVQKFLQKTYDILCDEGSFFETVNLHILQCDAEIKEDAVIHSRLEFEDYIEKMELTGYGGTDFRPVFYYVNELVEAHHFENLKGLLYFTDGRGDYPLKKPPYETAFVFIEGEGMSDRVPPWAMKVILKEDEVLLL